MPSWESSVIDSLSIHLHLVSLHNPPLLSKILSLVSHLLLPPNLAGKSRACFIVEFIQKVV
uniref:Uncharacterized protein n=1 Tax=Picea glauca TaxID=3330 RepID=A0A101LVQ7_PICGL|nr:hypothetical protein ABT39_MTgene1750 [Picea glauca]QHR88416.1 hypothetical protein Q903MT_gene2429 [Picea sitchensis]